MSRAVVLLRGILDPELAPDRFRLDPATGRPAKGLPADVIGPFERSALELALQLRDAGGIERVEVLAAGPAETASLLRKAIGAGADDATLVEVDGLDGLDPWPAVEVLARALDHMGDAALILTGRQAGDWDTGQVGYLLAERLGRPCVALTRRVTRAEDGFHAVHDTPAGKEEVVLAPPAVLTVTSDPSTVLRLAKVPALLAAARRPLTTLTLADLGLEGSLPALARLDVRSVRVVERTTEVEMIDGETPADVIAALAVRLHALRPR